MIRPLRNWLCIKPDECATKSEGGILLPPKELERDEIASGTVLAVGPGELTRKGTRETMWDIRVGNRVRYSQRGSVSTNDCGNPVLMIRRDAVIGEAA